MIVCRTPSNPKSVYLPAIPSSILQPTNHLNYNDTYLRLEEWAQSLAMKFRSAKCEITRSAGNLANQIRRPITFTKKRSPRYIPSTSKLNTRVTTSQLQPSPVSALWNRPPVLSQQISERRHTSNRSAQLLNSSAAPGTRSSRFWTNKVVAVQRRSARLYRTHRGSFWCLNQ